MQSFYKPAYENIDMTVSISNFVIFYLFESVLLVFASLGTLCAPISWPESGRRE